MTYIRAIAGRFLASAALIIASFFDRGIDHLIGGFVVLDAKLEAQIDRLEARAAVHQTVIDKSNGRVDTFLTAEQRIRDASLDRSVEAANQAARARRVRRKIADLVN